MFEKETIFIADYIINKVKNAGSGVTFEKLLASDINPAVLKYISSEIDYLIYLDRKDLIANSVFDYSGAEIARYFSLIGEEIKKSKKISFEYIKKLIHQAVSFNLNFVLRPKWSLIKLIFNETQVKSIDEIDILLNHIYYYSYLKNIILSYAAKRKLESISVVEFELILDKIDKELFTKQPNNLIENALWSMSEFINYGSNFGSKIPLQPVEIFLKEKNQIDYLFRLRRAFTIDSTKRYEIEDIKKIIFTPFEAQTGTEFQGEHEFVKEHEIEKEPEFIKEPEVTEGTVSDLTEEPVQEEVLPEEDKNSLPGKDESENKNIEDEEEYNMTIPEEDDILKVYDEELRSLEELERQLSIDPIDLKDDGLYEFEEESEENELKEIEKELLGSDEFLVTGDDADKDIKPKEKSKFSFFKKKEPESEPEKEPEVSSSKDIFTFFTHKEMDRIANAVFNDDRDDFVTTMEKISECSSYDDATEIVKGVFLTYRINPYSRDAVALTNAVANYFNQG